VLEDALLLTETMAPAAYAAAHEVMGALGRKDAIELFQSSGNGTDNAFLVLHGNPVGVLFFCGYLGTLDRGSLLAVLGHASDMREVAPRRHHGVGALDANAPVE
jgi:hypothetical protein